MNKKNVFLWALYDFANTPIIAAFTGLYLVQWIVLDNHVDDIWYGLTFALSTILLLITASFWGAWSDRLGKRMPFVSWTTFALIIFGFLIAFVAVSSFPRIPKVVIVLFLFFFAQYAYQLSLVFYDALLYKISTPKTIGKISGIGEAFSEAGWIFGPAVLLPFAAGKITLFGEPGRSQVFLPAVLLLIILGLPMIFWFKEPKSERTKVKKYSVFKGVKELFRKNKNVALFLTAFMFVSDALLTATLYFAIYLDQIYKIDDNHKFAILALMEIIAIISAYLIGKASDRFGIKKLLILSCFSLTIGLFLASLSPYLSWFYLFTVIIGVGFGGFYATARVFLIRISPPNQLGEYFGFYATFQRFASIVGPLVWGAVTLFLKDLGVMRYRLAILSLVFLMAIGLFLLTKVKENVNPKLGNYEK